MSLKEQIREAMRAQGVSVEELAARVEQFPSRIEHVLDGSLDNRVSTLERLAHGLGCEIALVPKDAPAKPERRVDRLITLLERLVERGN